MTQSSLIRPDYLRGTFDWRDLGYTFHQPPPAELLRRDIPPADLWNRVGQFLLRCRSGEMPDSSPLRDIVSANNVNEPQLLQACYDLIGDIAGAEEIEFLKHVIEYGEKNQVLSACWSAVWTASVDLVPSMLKASQSLTREADRDAVRAAISNMLESDDGEEDLKFYDFDGSDEQYVGLVSDHIAELSRSWPNCRRFFAGKPLDLTSIARSFLETSARMVYEDKTPQTSLLMLRRWFESSSGVDCQHMFNSQRFNPGAALEILEDWHDTRPIKFDVGKKYFLGSVCD